MKILHFDNHDLYFWRTTTHKYWLGFRIPAVWDIKSWEVFRQEDILHIRTPWIYFYRAMKIKD